METNNSALIYPYIWDIVVLWDLLIGLHNEITVLQNVYLGRSLFWSYCIFQAVFICMDTNDYAIQLWREPIMREVYKQNTWTFLFISVSSTPLSFP